MALGLPEAVVCGDSPVLKDGFPIEGVDLPKGLRPGRILQYHMPGDAQEGNAFRKSLVTKLALRLVEGDFCPP